MPSSEWETSPSTGATLCWCNAPPCMVEQNSLLHYSKDQDRTKSTSVMLVELMQLLQTIDPNSAEAKLNETTMSDNNGGRINY